MNDDHPLSPEAEIAVYERLEQAKAHLKGVVQDGSLESYAWAWTFGFFRGQHDGFDQAERIATHTIQEHRTLNHELLQTQQRLVEANRQLTHAVSFWVVCSGVLALILGIHWWRS